MHPQEPRVNPNGPGHDSGTQTDRIDAGGEQAECGAHSARVDGRGPAERGLVENAEVSLRNRCAPSPVTTPSVIGLTGVVIAALQGQTPSRPACITVPCHASGYAGERDDHA